MLMFDLRYDNIHNQLTDNFKAGGTDLSGSADFNKPTGRIGFSWNPKSNFYIAFTEPDPDGNSYQPGPMGEVFISARILLGM